MYHNVYIVLLVNISDPEESTVRVVFTSFMDGNVLGTKLFVKVERKSVNN